MLLYGDESEALTHPYLARAWAERGADLRVPAPGQAKKVAMMGSLDHVLHRLIVHTSRGPRSRVLSSSASRRMTTACSKRAVPFSCPASRVSAFPRLFCVVAQGTEILCKACEPFRPTFVETLRPTQATEETGDDVACLTCLRAQRGQFGLGRRSDEFASLGFAKKCEVLRRQPDRSSAVQPGG